MRHVNFFCLCYGYFRNCPNVRGSGPVPQFSSNSVSEWTPSGRLAFNLRPSCSKLSGFGSSAARARGTNAELIPIPQVLLYNYGITRARSGHEPGIYFTRKRLRSWPSGSSRCRISTGGIPPRPPGQAEGFTRVTRPDHQEISFF